MKEDTAPSITITISGKKGAGKTVIADRLTRLLRKAGCDDIRRSFETGSGVQSVKVNVAPPRSIKNALAHVAPSMSVLIIETPSSSESPLMSHIDMGLTKKTKKAAKKLAKKMKKARK